MGTDIHPVVQVRRGGEWQDVADVGPLEDDPKYRWAILSERNYQLFAVLADQRNGYGFAGVATGDAVKPIAEPRGFPEGFAVDDSEYHGKDEDGEGRWMGDHSHTWISLRELQEYPWTTAIQKTGVISFAAFQAWDRRSQPDHWSGGISGRGVLVVSHAQAESFLKHGAPENVDIHVQITWDSTIGHRCGQFIDKVIPWLATLGAPDDVRIVMGFDS